MSDSTGNRKLYVILQDNLTNGQMMAQTAHAVAKLVRVSKYDRLETTPVVCVTSTNAQMATTMEELAFNPGVTWTTFAEPDYDFHCVTVAALIPGNMPFKNQILGKLKLVQ